MKPADDVEFSDGLRPALAGPAAGLVERHGVSAGCVGLRPKAHKLQLATQTSVGLICRLTLK